MAGEFEIRFGRMAEQDYDGFHKDRAGPQKAGIVRMLSALSDEEYNQLITEQGPRAFLAAATKLLAHVSGPFPDDVEPLAADVAVQAMSSHHALESERGELAAAIEGGDVQARDRRSLLHEGAYPGRSDEPGE